jgi:hypothetical protein
MASGLPKWVSELLDNGEKLEVCLELLKNMQATEREDRQLSNITIGTETIPPLPPL